MMPLLFNRLSNGKSIAPTVGVAVVFAATACTSATQDPDTGETGEEESLAACEAPLRLTPETQFAEPYGLATFQASGGTGDYQYTLQSTDTDAKINIDTGVFVAGASPNRTETIVVRDRGCIGEAEATVDIVEPLVVIPSKIELSVNTNYAWSVSGGSGDFTASIFQNQTGGSLSTDQGTTGSIAGNDLVYITDNQTGTVQSIQLVVRETMTFEAVGRQWLGP